jgi:spore maturation protein CgeB
LKTRRVQTYSDRAVLPVRVGENNAPVLELDSVADTESLLSPPGSLFRAKLPESSRPKLKIVILGLSITSDNGHAATYRGWVRELSARGHDVLFLERDIEALASDRDLPKPLHGRTEIYSHLRELKDRFSSVVRAADFVIVDSEVNEGIAIGEWVTSIAQGATAFYDVDLMATMENLIKGREGSISSTLIPRYQMYLSATGGPWLEYVEKKYGSPMARPLYCSVDAMLYFPERQEMKWDLGYAGSHSDDRQPVLDRLLIEPARRWGKGRFVVAGSEYPRSVRWPKNVKRISNFPPGKQRAFYNSQRFTLNLTPPGVIAAGFSPSARLFEAAACGTPIITEFWPGLETFFKPGKEILISHSTDETLIYLQEISELERRRMGYRARECVLARHTTRHRALELENYALQVLKLAAA